MASAGDVAVIHFTGRIADGEDEGAVFDTTDVDVALDEGIYHDHRDYKPLEFHLGDGTVLAGIDEAVQDMTVGEERVITLDPEGAFGTVEDDRIVEIPRDELEARSETTAEAGELVRADDGPTGWITSVGEETVTVDFNHELAGETVEFELKLLDRYEDE